jgi:tRNA U34 2-thiouridine synthase MnmA/TrmU
MYILPNEHIYCHDCVTKYTSGQKQVGKYEERYKEGVEVPWYCDDEKIVLEFVNPVRAAAKGQSVVIYTDNYVVAGGFIENAIK